MGANVVDTAKSALRLSRIKNNLLLWLNWECSLSLSFSLSLSLSLSLTFSLCLTFFLMPRPAQSWKVNTTCGLAMSPTSHLI